MAGKREQIEYGDMKVPILRENCREVYIALKPPEAQPYMVAPHAMEPSDMVKFYAERVDKVEDLREKMLKRFAKSSSLKCTYRTGDIAYVMGRPFMLQVHPLGKMHVQGGSRGRATVKYAVDTEVSLLTLFVAKVNDYDQAKAAFDSYCHTVIRRNAPNMTARCCGKIRPDEKVPPVRLREMKNRFAHFNAGCLWLSTRIAAYPVDCLVYAIWHEMMQHATVSEEEAQAALEQVLPGWQRAAEILRTQAQPYSNQ